MQQVVIPAVERMITKEMEHRNMLNSYKGQVDVSEFIENSETSIAHLQFRLGQYLDYTKNLK